MNKTYTKQAVTPVEHEKTPETEIELGKTQDRELRELEFTGGY